jgi:dihydrofolate synthase/folylpolyglutamate synthase
MGFFENTFAVVGMLADKDMAGVVEALRGRFDRWYVASPEAERAAPAETLAKIVREHAPEAALRSFATVTAALEAARRDAGPNDRIVVFGSFYTVAEALRSVR